MKTWMSLAGVEDMFIRSGAHQAIWVNLTSYRPPDVVAEWVVQKPQSYFLQMGHGRDGSPELYSGGPGYLITAGGVANDRFSQCVARPISLMLEDGAMDLEELLHVAGPGEEYKRWNTTGVHRNFAVAAGSVSIPKEWEPVAQNKTWKIFEQANQHIATHSADSLGIFCLLSKRNAKELLSRLTEANLDAHTLENHFQWPSGPSITYDVHAPQNQWVITSVDGKPVDRDHGQWPLMKGDVPGWIK